MIPTRAWARLVCLRYSVRCLHPDHLGSTRVCTDASGNPAGTCAYEPFAEFRGGATSCLVPTNYRFAGMGWDAETSLYHTWFRQYDATQGRWMGVDPIPGSSDDPQSLNRYAYVGNDPVNSVDPLGLCRCEGWGLFWVTYDEDGNVVDEEFIEGSEYLVCFACSEGGGGGGKIDLSKPPPPPKPNECDPAMIAAFNEIWSQTMRFPDRQREAAFRLDYDGGRFDFYFFKGPEVKPSPENPPHVSILTIKGKTVAVGHTHPGSGRPSGQDRKSPYPNYVVSLFELWVTDPNNPTEKGGPQTAW